MLDGRGAVKPQVAHLPAGGAREDGRLLELQPGPIRVRIRVLVRIEADARAGP